ncbi:MAG: AAA family ATPase, partial [Candidatus Bathyarchaeia archaeon]
MSEVQLRVLDSRQRDVARGIARIDPRTMQKLGVSSGDAIEILGKKKTSAIAWPAYSEDQDPSVMRIDGFLRKNASVSINEYVVVRKAEVKNAMSIVLAPVDMRLNVDED